MPCLTFSGIKVHLLEDENIENSKNICGWILLKFWEISDKNLEKKNWWDENWSKVIKILEKTPRNDQISNNTHIKAIYIYIYHI